LKHWREIHGLTQADVAKACGVWPNTIARCEQGVQMPRPELLQKLMTLTGLSMEEIVCAVMQPKTSLPRGRPKRQPPPP